MINQEKYPSPPPYISPSSQFSYGLPIRGKGIGRGRGPGWLRGMGKGRGFGKRFGRGICRGRQSSL